MVILITIKYNFSKYCYSNQYRCIIIYYTKQKQNTIIMIEFVSTTVIICAFFLFVCGSYYLKDRYYRNNYYDTRQSYTSYKPLNDNSFSEHI